MNTWIIYDSRYGNTEKIVQAMTLALKNYGTVRAISAGEADMFSLVNDRNVDLLIIGCPTQQHKVSTRMESLLDTLPSGSLKGLPTATFDTRYHAPRWLSGSAAHKLADVLDEKGAHIVVQPQSFFVAQEEGPLQKGELDHAAAWAQSILEQLATPE